MSGFENDFGGAVRDHLRDVEQANSAALGDAADRMLDAVRSGCLVHTAGSGHSIAMVMETFYRAGGLACVRPLFHPALLPLFGARASTALERVGGLAGSLVAHAGVRPGHVGVVFSNSGVNAYPVEVAERLREAGAYVVAFSSVPHMSAARPRVHAKLADVADLVVDNRIPEGDAVHDGVAGRVAPLSTCVNAYLWDLLLVTLADRAAAAGVTLPVWTSSNVPGGDEANAAHLAAYAPTVPML